MPYMDLWVCLLPFQLFVSTCSNDDEALLLLKQSDAFVVDVCNVKWCVLMNKCSYQKIGLYCWVWILLKTEWRHVLSWLIDVFFFFCVVGLR